MWKSLFLCVLLLFFGLGWADTLQIKQDAPKKYIVKKGDTLWDISGLYLNEPWLWPKLWRFNPQIENPHLIFPGDIISLIFDDQGRPMLVVEKRAVKSSPKQRIKPKAALPLVSLETVKPYLDFHRVISEQESEELPYVLGANTGYKYNPDLLKVYVKGELPESEYYAVYRRGRSLHSPEGDVLGFKAELVAIATPSQSAENTLETTTLEVSTGYRELMLGDLVLPYKKSTVLPALYQLDKPQEQTRGAIIDTMHRGREAGKFDVVMVNLGQEQGVKPGHVLSILHSSPAVIDMNRTPKYYDDATQLERFFADIYPNMPMEKIGELLLVDVYDKVSYGLIVESSHPARLLDKVVTP